MRRAFLSLALLACASRCGDPFVHRPLVIDVQNVSASAQAIILKAAPADESPGCGELQLSNVERFEATAEARWLRGGETRELDLPKIDADEVTLVVYTEDSQGRPIQMACVDIRYPEIETGRMTLRLGASMAAILTPCHRCSARSSSIGCSDEEAWRRSSSPIGSTTRALRRWS